MTDTTVSSAPGPGAAIAHWLLRIALASVFLFHGIQKFMSLEKGAEMMNLSVPVWSAVAFAEVIGPVLLLLGGLIRTRLGDIMTRLGALALIPVMLGAIAMVHWPRWSFTPSETHPMGGMEFQVVLLLIQLYFLIRGNEA